ncbi:hypothetical protein AHF37_05282 [Paragonimus kellicotti]|nr:hypothetical protein AHF37_05282 [Paragonimus kellicotti]
MGDSDNPQVVGLSETSIDHTLESLSLVDRDSFAHSVSDCSPDKHECLAEETEVDYEEQAQQQTVIRKALDQQTQILFEQYAREQHPKDPAKQKELVLDMQEQYFTRYMTEMQHSQLIHQQQQLDQWDLIRKQKSEEGCESDEDTERRSTWPLIPATIWTRKEIADFKQEILKTQRDCCIKIGSLATATIRVPTHLHGTSIFWEFATDYYDLGFGLYFEWDLEPPNTISVNISESSDEEDLDGEDEDISGHEPPHTVHEEPSVNDVERGHRHSGQSRFPTDELIPVYRRDCHTEVYCGSHHYPGVGVYVFKFDNSFSLWRSKWLYYRIYYTQ